MAANTPTYVPSTRKWSWKDILFPLISGAIGLLLVLGAMADIFLPWFPNATIHDPTVAVPVMHLWHYTQRGMHSLFLFALPLLLLVWRARHQVLLMQFMLVSVGFMVAFLLPVRPMDALTVAIALVVLTALYPNVRSLTNLPALGNISRPLLGLTLLCSPFLLYESVRLVVWQIQGVGGDHATAGHWIASATAPLALITAGLFAATKQPGWHTLGMVPGLSLLYLGAAAIALPNNDGSWGLGGGTVSLIAGSAYVLLTGYEAYGSKVQARSTRLTAVPTLGKLGIAALIGFVCIVIAAQVIFDTTADAGNSPQALTGLPVITSPGFTFNQPEIKAKAGETIAFRFDNTHNAPHSFDIDALHVHVPAAPGEQRLVRFTPTKPGTYTFYCAIPGHREMGMEGRLVVEP